MAKSADIVVKIIFLGAHCVSRLRAPRISSAFLFVVFFFLIKVILALLVGSTCRKASCSGASMSKMFGVDSG